VIHFEAAKLQEPPKNVLKHKSAKIPDVRIVIHRRPTGVHADFTALQGREGFDLSAQRVMEAYFVHRGPDGILL
jgi:hypothetical protein